MQTWMLGWMAQAAGLPERQRLLESLQQGNAGPEMLLTGLGVAFFLGAAHALTPGHGKAIVAAYLLGSRGTVWDAVYLGSVVTVTHTASVFALGLATLYASQQIQMDRIYPWLSLVSGLLVVGMGLWLLARRWKAASHGHDHEHHHHHLGHEHHHDHGHEHGHTHAHPGEAATRRSLLGLGISGGLAPCPEALVVLLMAISIGKLALGLVILVVFSLGLAAVLIAIGVAMVVSGPALGRLAPTGRLGRALPVGSAAVVTLLGAVIVYQAVVGGRLLRF